MGREHASILTEFGACHSKLCRNIGHLPARSPPRPRGRGMRPARRRARSSAPRPRTSAPPRVSEPPAGAPRGSARCGALNTIKRWGNFRGRVRSRPQENPAAVLRCLFSRRLVLFSSSVRAGARGRGRPGSRGSSRGRWRTPHRTKRRRRSDRVWWRAGGSRSRNRSARPPPPGWRPGLRRRRHREVPRRWRKASSDLPNARQRRSRPGCGLELRPQGDRPAARHCPRLSLLAWQTAPALAAALAPAPGQRLPARTCGQPCQEP
jgi:hypothetical protein